ncbi:hypothetical protein E2C01_061160 [Portunus trituberculatus]|uniref:Uncharacterized protein n=1 Tax=Portunus trituberculatus TaxID=210409 RepID=A0A5B7H4H2_PORTR|nr:hypothetical protein [Portunus trituberculatus]
MKPPLLPRPRFTPFCYVSFLSPITTITTTSITTTTINGIHMITPYLSLRQHHLYRAIGRTVKIKTCPFQSLQPK